MASSVPAAAASPGGGAGAGLMGLTGYHDAPTVIASPAGASMAAASRQQPIPKRASSKASSSSSSPPSGSPEKSSKGASSSSSSEPKEKKCCAICGDAITKHNCIHYGGLSCYSCRAFFRRAHQGSKTVGFTCKSGGNCEVNVKTRRKCQKCR